MENAKIQGATWNNKVHNKYILKEFSMYFIKVIHAENQDAVRYARWRS